MDWTQFDPLRAFAGGALIGFAAFLVECGIDSISVSPDSFIAVKRQVAAAEAALSAIKE